MDIFDELRASFGDDFFDRRPTEPGLRYQRWCVLCVCGHLDRYHSATVGGTHELLPPRSSKRRGESFALHQEFDGCVGAIHAKGFEKVTLTFDDEARTGVERIHPTCPCTEFRPVARVDRPNYMFNQRMPTEQHDPSRHPFVTGVRALTTHLGKRKPAIADPTWATAEFSRRFVWLDGKRACSISRCTETADVWPCFVNGEALSELRCGAHRPA